MANPAAMARILPLQGGSNFRDVGGYRTQDGRTVRWRHFFRSGAFGQLTDADIALLDELKIRTNLDLRCTQERELVVTRWTTPRVIAHDYSSDHLFGRMTVPQEGQGISTQSDQHYRNFPDLLRPHVRSMFDALRADDIPIVINCSAGQDRTGFAVGMLLAALGVAEAEIIEDYLPSTLHRQHTRELDLDEVRRLAASNPVAAFYAKVLDERGPAALAPRPLVDEGGRAKLLIAFDTIAARWGSIAGYLADECGLGADAVATMRSKYLI